MGVIITLLLASTGSWIAVCERCQFCPIRMSGVGGFVPEFLKPSTIPLSLQSISMAKFSILSFFMVFVASRFQLSTGSSMVRTRSLESFDDIPDECQDYASSITFGQSSVLSTLTGTDRYDLRKRPNTSPVVSGTYAGRDATTDPDDVTVEIRVSSLKSIDQLSQSMTLRYTVYNILFLEFFLALIVLCVCSVYEIVKWSDPRLVFDPTGDAKCVVGAGTPSNPFIALESFDVSGVDSIMWVMNSLGVFAVMLSLFVSVSLVGHLMSMS
jgi:hypothetical protein